MLCWQGANKYLNSIIKYCLASNISTNVSYWRLMDIVTSGRCLLYLSVVNELLSLLSRWLVRAKTEVLLNFVFNTIAWAPKTRTSLYCKQCHGMFLLVQKSHVSICCRLTYKLRPLDNTWHDKPSWSPKRIFKLRIVTSTETQLSNTSDEFLTETRFVSFKPPLSTGKSRRNSFTGFQWKWEEKSTATQTFFWNKMCMCVCAPLLQICSTLKIET